MKILIVNTRHFPAGGDSVYAFRLAELLKSAGHRVSWFAMQDSRNLPDPDEDLFVSHIDFRELAARKTIVGGLRVASRVVYSVEARQKFSVALDRHQPDVICLQNIHAHITPSVILEAKHRGIPVTWMLHDYKLLCPNTHFFIDRTSQICEACGPGYYYEPLLKRCKKGSLLASGMAAIEAMIHRMMGVRRMVDAFIAPSRFLAQRLLAAGFPTDRVHHIPFPVPDDWFLPSAAERGEYLLFSGRLESIKGVEVLLGAARRSPQTKIMLAGSGSLTAYAKGLALPNVELLGQVDQAKLASLVARARAVVVPSIVFENQPMSMLEAFAACTPVIASRLGGMEELGADGRARLIEPNDEAALASTFDWVTNHPSECQTMTARARHYAETEHASDLHIDRVEMLWRRLALRDRGAPLNRGIA